ncbi:MAG: carboxymuconolactone decarboxylase family protein [Pseudomonadota bacterium]|mgnify:CR=1 FL=1
MTTHHKDWPNMAATLNPAVRELRLGSPETMAAFGEMAKAALAPKALDTKTKELMALAIGVAVRCDACLAYHAEAARKHGATREEISETLALAVYMGAGPSVMYAAQALEAFDQWSEKAAV